MPCRVNGCKQNHQKHFCKFCKMRNSNHFSSQCYFKDKTHCKVDNCKENHVLHYCRVCRNKNSDHFASSCPEGIVLYHGTKLQWAKSIKQNGFKPSQDGRLGPGVYFTDDKDQAIRIAKRWKTTAGLLQCRLDQDSDFVKGGIHPQWINVTVGQFQQYCVHPSHINRIKIVKLHEV